MEYTKEQLIEAQYLLNIEYNEKKDDGKSFTPFNEVDWNNKQTAITQIEDLLELVKQ